MEGLFEKSLTEKMPIVIMYMTDDRVITDRQIIVRSIHPNYIRAYCMKRQQLRTFKRENILATDLPRKKRNLHYA